MENQVLGVIGAKGKMAKWFLNHFKSEFKSVCSFDLKTKENLKTFCQKCNVILVSVPISETVKMLREIKPFLKKEQLVMDFSSLKEAPCNAMNSMPCQAIGLHPLFGPKAKDFSSLSIVFCPVKKGRFYPGLKKLFISRKIRVIQVEPKEHDRAMAFLQALNHVTHLAYSSALVSLNKKLMNGLETTSFKYMKKGMLNILRQDSRLYMEIALHNPYFSTVLKKFQKKMAEVQTLLTDKNEKSFERLFNSQKAFWGL